MSQNILITGAAGYIGGSIVADFLYKHSTEVYRKQIFAAVRSEEQAEALSSLGINVLKLDLTDEQVATDSITSNQINVVIHTASSIDPGLAFPLINALAKQGETTGKATHFIHTSALSAFYEKAGWPPTVNQDTDPVFETEKELANSYPVRKADVAIIEHAEARGVDLSTLVDEAKDGRGSGPWNQLSVVLPGLVRASLKLGKVYKFDENITVQGVHISDLTALYWQIIKAILHNETIPSGTEGYYFAVAHDIDVWEFLDHLATAFKTRGLATDERPEVFPSDDFAADAIGVPVQFLGPLWKNGGSVTATRPQSIGWKPEWDNAQFLDHVDHQINDVLELGKAKSSLIDSLFAAVGEMSVENSYLNFAKNKKVQIVSKGKAAYCI
ncbi:hypothetical protein FSARC_7166 [Fusarium sarcochroum]|uniref:NAD-dependent epimerase/dehydratase domain-containing protein n=1 Tax=Fusarium sarcochroum TaxID=1208366 RepID=A0A8H4TVZ2_9HYPO|nr:hypothetical protein FSARC_7166 [Fusarium sarcochroum]